MPAGRFRASDRAQPDPGHAAGQRGDREGWVRALFDAAIGRFGGVDIAVNTVGKVLKKPFLDTSEAEYDEMFAINSKAAYFFIQEAGGD